MTLVIYILAIIAFIASIAMLKSAYKLRQDSDYHLLRCKILLRLVVIAMREAEATIKGESMGTLPSSEERELLLNRANNSYGQARVVLAVLEDVFKENNLTY